jgi:hypothetical protein
MEDRTQGVTVAAIARDFGTFVLSLYRWHWRPYAALSDAPPGPSAAIRTGSLSDAQHALLAAAASASTATLSLRERRAWILQLHGEGVSVCGIRDVVLHRVGPTEALSVGSIEAFLKQAGRIACSLLVTLVQPVLERVVTVAGDNIYLHGQAVKVGSVRPVFGRDGRGKRGRSPEEREWHKSAPLGKPLVHRAPSPPPTPAPRPRWQAPRTQGAIPINRERLRLLFASQLQTLRRERWRAPSHGGFGSPPHGYNI